MDLKMNKQLLQWNMKQWEKLEENKILFGIHSN